MLNSSSRKDSNEEIWSRGSRSGSVDSPPSSNTFLFEFDKLQEKPNLYRYDTGGVIVYLSSARISGEKSFNKSDSRPFQDQQVKKINQKDLDSIPQAGKFQIDKKTYIEIKKLPCKPEFIDEFTIDVPKHSLRFNSKFECGNLQKAIMVSESLYTLYLEKEPGNVCLQWYYFEVRNQKPLTVTFKIMNLGKFESLYNEGMKPLVRSKKEGDYWKRGGFGVSYLQNTDDLTYTLTFSYQFAQGEDSVFFAYSYPYSYLDLMKDIGVVLDNYSDIARVDKICESFCGNPVYMITITDDVTKYFTFSEEKYYSQISAAQRGILRKRKIRSGCKNEYAHKKGVFITSRVHPGETVSSFMMQGCLEFLLSPQKSAQILRKHFVFKLIPMLNPDGVRYGRTRVSLIGADLNRRWAEPHPLLHPCIYTAKKYLKVFSEMHECLLYCDLHGHSIKKNVFFYGCNEKPLDLEQSKKNIMARVIPYLLSKRNKLVSYKDSRFRMEKNKESTARISIYRHLNIVNSLTLEASFYGPSSLEAFSKPREDLHMLPDDLKSIGRDLCHTLLVYLSSSFYIKTIQSVSRCLREQYSPAKPVFLSQDPVEEEDGVLHNFHKDIINCEDAWKEIQFEYESEESSNSSASDIEEENVNDGRREEKNEIIRRPYKTVTPPRLNRRPAKIVKSEKSEISLSPEAYFKMPGISVFSFNLRAKSSEVLSKESTARPKEKQRFLDPEGKTNKLFILNSDSKGYEKADSNRIKLYNFESAAKFGSNSKFGYLLKPPKVKRSDLKQSPLGSVTRNNTQKS